MTTKWSDVDDVWFQGKIDLNFDGKFIYAEVNASKKFWKKTKAG